MKAIIYLDVPEWQIGQEVSVYFPDTMVQHATCEPLKEQEAKEALFIAHNGTMGWECPRCKNPVDRFFAGEQMNYCGYCGQKIYF